MVNNTDNVVLQEYKRRETEKERERLACISCQKKMSKTYHMSNVGQYVTIFVTSVVIVIFQTIHHYLPLAAALAPVSKPPVRTPAPRIAV